MSKKTTNNAEPIGNITRVADFLPPPSQLVSRDDSIKITLSLSKESVDFFKGEAKKNAVPYQRMIRNLIDQYAQQHAPQ